MSSSRSCQLEIRGLLNDVNFHMAKFCAEDLHNVSPYFEPPVIVGMLEFDWKMYLEEKRKEMRGEVWVFNDSAITFLNDKFIGGANDFLKWAEEEHGYKNFRPMALYETLAEEAYKSHLNSKNHDYVYMDIEIGEKSAGRILIELFSDLVPKTCENFRSLCTGEKGESVDTEYKLHYKNSLFHRLVPNGWIQGGGDGGESIYGPVFEDENFSVAHSRRGILSMANKGRHTNGSQFFITLQPAKWMDTNYVAFGQVIEGTETLQQMEEQETLNTRPLQDVRVVDCGVCTYEF